MTLHSHRGATPLLLARSELRRLSSGRLLRLALAALLLIPSLYGGLYLWANHDPYANFDAIPAAVVSEDEGTTLETGERLAVGDDVAAELVEKRAFDWHAVDRAEALAGVEDGTYDFALVLPRTFSADLASPAGPDPRQATLVLETNDANNYMTTLIGNTLVKEVNRAVAEQVSETAASRLLLGFSTIHDQLGEAADGAGQLADGADTAADGAGQLADGAGELATGLGDLRVGAQAVDEGAGRAAAGGRQLSQGANDLSDGLARLDDGAVELPGQTRRLADGAAEVAEGTAQVSVEADRVASASGTLREGLTDGRAALRDRLAAAGLTQEELDAVDGELDRLGGPVVDADTRIQEAAGDLRRLDDGAHQVADGADRLADGAQTLSSGIHRASSGADELAAGAASLSSGLDDLADGTGRLADGAGSAEAGATRLADGAADLADGVDRLHDGSVDLAAGLRDGRDAVPNLTDAERAAVAQTLGNPLHVESDSFSSAGSYGAGLAPMFIALALWIGAYTLFLVVRPLAPRALATNEGSLRTALGGWLAPAGLAVAQAGVLLAVVGLLLDIRVAHPALAFGFAVLVGATFVAVLQALAARLGAVGKFLGLVLMVLQLVSAGGTFPWQTLPAPLQAVHHVLPMSYAIDGMRRLMYGADLRLVGLDVLVLLTYLLLSLLVTAAAARRARVWTPHRIRPELAL